MTLFLALDLRSVKVGSMIDGHCPSLFKADLGTDWIDVRVLLMVWVWDRGDGL